MSYEYLYDVNECCYMTWNTLPLPCMYNFCTGWWLTPEPVCSRGTLSHPSLWLADVWVSSLFVCVVATVTVDCSLLVRIIVHTYRHQLKERHEKGEEVRVYLTSMSCKQFLSHQHTYNYTIIISELGVCSFLLLCCNGPLTFPHRCCTSVLMSSST